MEHADQLADLLQDKKKLAYVNLIPYNPVSEHDQYSRSDKADQLRFYDRLKKRGINCVIRKEHGTDIDAACSQLRGKQMKKKAAVKVDGSRDQIIRSLFLKGESIPD